MEEVRVRFPPSPTGYLHIGGARTALYNWLFARKMGGKLILRIEDTDVERSSEESIQGILSALQWMGIDWDEGPYFQSDYIEEHRKVAFSLVEKSHAYLCFCTVEELSRKREEAKARKSQYMYDGTCRALSPGEVDARKKAGMPFVVRFKVPRNDGAVVFEDAVYGKIEKRYQDIEDFVILRSNGLPLYVLSNAVDDHRDRISHVIRGQDHLANTPKQILIYQAMGWPLPRFAHMNLTLDPSRRKISKRHHGEVATVQFYRERGFLPWAFCNFMALLGWSPGDDREIMDREELIEAFELERISKANSIFNYRPGDQRFFTDPKAISINAHYIRNMALEELFPYVKEEMVRSGLWMHEYEGEKREWFLKVIDLIRKRFTTLRDFSELGRPYFSEEFQIDEKAFNKHLKKDERLKQWFPELAERFSCLEDFSPEPLERTIRGMAEQHGIKAGLLINALRAAVTGQSVGPGLFEILEVIGKEKVISRIQRVAERI